MDEAPHMHVSVRVAEETDSDSIERLLRYFDTFHAEARPDFFAPPWWAPRSDDFLSNVLEDPLQNLLVAVLAGEVIGYVHVLLKQTNSPVLVERPYAEIDSVAVLPDAQRRGVGEKLIQSALEWATSEGVHDHQIAVHQFNAAARRLYEKLGFTPSVTLLRRKD
jgi:ribosomal protein S18 acetylase RimI-like enzyme